MMRESTDPLDRETVKLLERQGRSWYHTESIARQVARDSAKEIMKLREVLKAAQEHLEYIGYGDKWERECAMESKLEERIAEVLGIE